MRTAHSLLRVLLFVTLIALPCLQADAQHFTFRQYGQAQGLHNLNVTSMLQDRTGFLWVGTENGLYRYDGAQFSPVRTVEGIDDHDISAIHQDALGRIWISTLHEVFYQDNGIFRRITTQQKIQTELHSVLTSFPEDPNRIFLLNNHSLHVATSSDAGKTWRIAPLFSSQQVAKNPELESIAGVLPAPNQHLWIGCGLHLCDFHQGAIHIFKASQGLPQDRWKPVLLDSDGILWARGLHHIAACTASACTLKDNHLQRLLSGTEGGTLAEDSSGHILANLATGLARLENGSWRIFNAGNGVPAFPIGAIMVDRQDSPWLALTGHGLASWRGYDTWESYTTAEGLKDNQIWGIHQDSHGIWVGTQTDLQLLPSGKHRFRRRAKARFRPLPAVQTLTRSKDGHLWGGENEGDLIEYDPGRKRSHVVTNLRSILSLHADASDRLWICTSIGLYFLDLESRRRNQPTLVTEVPRTRFYKVVQDRSGSLWFMSNEGLFHLEKGQWKHIPLPADFKPQFAQHVALQADGSFWLNGVEPLSLLHARMDGDKLQVLDRIPPTNLASAEIVELDIDSRGWLWVGTDAGIDVFNGKQWRRIKEEEGLIWNDIDGASFFSAPDGTVWIGTSAGLAHLIHPENLFHSDALLAWVTEGKFGKELFASENQGQNSVLPWQRHPITFHLASSDFAGGESILFRYRLLNAEDWNATAEHELRYPPLPSGRYRLEVVAENLSRHTASPPVTLSFTILAPWWKTKTFYAVLGSILLLLIGLMWRWKIGLLLIRQHHLERLVAERTKELRAIASRDSLTGLLNRAAIFEQLNREMDRCRREGAPLAVVLADLDHFKEINDTYGHLAGDSCLKEYARRISAAIRGYDHVGRYGGEELMIIFPNIEPAVALKRLDQIRLSMSEAPFEFGEISASITCSFGLAWFDSSIHNSETLVEQADQALYRAKAKGRNRVEYYPALSSGC